MLCAECGEDEATVTIRSRPPGSPVLQDDLCGTCLAIEMEELTKRPDIPFAVTALWGDPHTDAIAELAKQLSPSLLPDLDARALSGLTGPASRWPGKGDQWPYGEASWFIRWVLLAIRGELPEDHWLRQAWYLKVPEG